MGRPRSIHGYQSLYILRIDYCINVSFSKTAGIATVKNGVFSVVGLKIGNIFLGIQPVLGKPYTMLI